MSRSGWAPPPFTTEAKKAPIAPRAKSIAAPSRDDPLADKGRKRHAGDPVVETVPADRAQEDTERVLKRHRTGKEPMGKEAALPPPPPNAVATSFAKLGHSTANEADMNAWSLSSMEENHAAITRATAEIFYRQASRHRDIRTLITTQKEVVKEAKSFKAKAESVAEEMRAMAKAHVT